MFQELAGQLLCNLCKHGTFSSSKEWSRIPLIAPEKQSSWDQHGAHLGPTGPRWAPCWPQELCYLGHYLYCWDSIAGKMQIFIHHIRAWLLEMQSLCSVHSGYGHSQWEKALLSNTSSHWLSPCPEWCLFMQQVLTQIFLYFIESIIPWFPSLLSWTMLLSYFISTLRLQHNGWQFADKIFIYISWKGHFITLIEIPLRFVSKDPPDIIDWGQWLGTEQVTSQYLNQY